MSTESTDITGRDAYIIRKALAYAIEAIDRLPPRWREESDREDMTTLLGAYGDADAHRLNARQHLTGRDNNAVDASQQLRDTIKQTVEFFRSN